MQRNLLYCLQPSYRHSDSTATHCCVLWPYQTFSPCVLQKPHLQVLTTLRRTDWQCQARRAQPPPALHYFTRYCLRRQTSEWIGSCGWWQFGITRNEALYVKKLQSCWILLSNKWLAWFLPRHNADNVFLPSSFPSLHFFLLWQGWHRHMFHNIENSVCNTSESL